LVGVDQTVWTYVQGPDKFWGRWGVAPLRWGVADPQEPRICPTRYHIKFGRCSSNYTHFSRWSQNLWGRWGPAPLGWGVLTR